MHLEQRSGVWIILPDTDSLWVLNKPLIKPGFAHKHSL